MDFSVWAIPGMFSLLGVSLSITATWLIFRRQFAHATVNADIVNMRAQINTYETTLIRVSRENTECKQECERMRARFEETVAELRSEKADLMAKLIVALQDK